MCYKVALEHWQQSRVSKSLSEDGYESLMDHNRAEMWMICALLALKPISHITKQNLSYLHSKKIEQMTKTMVDDGRRW